VLKVSELIPNIADKTFHSTAYKNLVRILSKNQNNEGFQYSEDSGLYLFKIALNIITKIENILILIQNLN
jgi:hypothetical protein